MLGLVTTSFAVEPDPFALQSDAGEKPHALLVKLNGREILKRTESFPGGTPVQTDHVEGIVEGLNELYVEANPPLDQAGRSHAVRVRVLRDGRPVLERSFWSEPGARIATTFALSVEKTDRAKREENHDH